MAIYYALMSFKTYVKGNHVRVLSDNTTAIAVINNMGTIRSTECNIVAQDIWNFCRSYDIWITCAHIPGVFNVESDKESRKEYKQAEWMLNRAHYHNAIKKFKFSPEIDCFATRINCQHPVYASFKPDPYAKFIDAFSIHWGTFKCYLFPPFSVIARVLQKLRIDKTTALCVLPHWPTQAWWPQMIKMLVKPPLILKPNMTNLILPSQPKEVHPLHQKLKLVVCLLSGTTMKNKGCPT